MYKINPYSTRNASEYDQNLVESMGQLLFMAMQIVIARYVGGNPKMLI